MTERDQFQKLLQEITKEIEEGNTALFCGAGISFGSGLPGAWKQKDYVLKKLPMTEKSLYSPQGNNTHWKYLDQNSGLLNKMFAGSDSSKWRFKENFKENLERSEMSVEEKEALGELWESTAYSKIQEAMPFEVFWETLAKQYPIDKIIQTYTTGEPNATHFLIAKLGKIEKLKTIVTTNFDVLIERALKVEKVEFKVYSDETEFSNIDYETDIVNVIKIHGSARAPEYGILKENVRTTMSDITMKRLSEGRMDVIRNVFSTGTHKNVLVLGYSSSDVFDLVPQIASINESKKRVFYVQDSKHAEIEDIRIQQEKNPFRGFEGSYRLYCSTNDLIEEIWKSNFDSKEFLSVKKRASTLIHSTLETWQTNVDSWFEDAEDKSSSIKWLVSGNPFQHVSKHHLALESYGEGLKTCRMLRDKHEKSCIYAAMGSTLDTLGEYTESQKAFKKALSLSKHGREKHLRVAHLTNLGISSQRNGKYREAILLAKKALQLAKKTGDRVGKKNNLANLGNAYQNLGQFDRALALHEESRKLALEIGDKHAEGIAHTELGISYEKTGKYERAKECFIEALQIAKNLGDKNGEGSALGNLGNSFLSLGIYNKAISCHEAALTIAIDIGDKEGEANRHGSLGNDFGSIGDFENAINHVTTAHRIFESLGNRKGLAGALNTLGILYQKTDDHKKAITECERALAIAREIGTKWLEGEILGNLGNAYGKLGKYEKAIEHIVPMLKIMKPILGERDSRILLSERNLQLAQSSLYRQRSEIGQ